MPGATNGTLAKGTLNVNGPGVTIGEVAGCQRTLIESLDMNFIEDMLNKLRGMFAFVIWDSEKETLFGARDFFGIKPFYYAVVDGNLVYGSEIKSILEYPGYKKQLNETALENYLTFQYSVLDETFFKGIYKLMPSHCLTFHNGELNVKRYWEATHWCSND